MTKPSIPMIITIVILMVGTSTIANSKSQSLQLVLQEVHAKLRTERIESTG